MNALPTPEETRISSGIAGLDDVLMGGWPTNHLYLVEGAPGAGKTTVGLQFLLEGALRGETVLYVTLSESKRELEEVAASHHWPIEKIPIFEYTPTEDMLRPEDQYSAFHPSELEFQDTTQNILKKVEELRPSRIVFDSLSEIRLLARDSLRYRRQVLALKHFFINRNCTVLLLDDRTSSGQDLQLQSIAHGVLMLERLDRDYGVERRRLRVAKLRGSHFREGFHDYVIKSGGVQVYPRLISAEHPQQFFDGKAKSGIDQLDALWNGGVPYGTSTLITGPAGAGKSSIAIAYAVAAAKRGETAALFHFDETIATLFRRSAQLGFDLQHYVKAGAVHLTRCDPAEISPGGFTDSVRQAVSNLGARILVIDTLNGYLNSMAGEHHLLLQMHELCTFLNQKGVVTFLILAQAGILGPQMTSPVDLSYLADNVLLLRFFESKGQVRKAISIVKNRSGSHEDTIRELRFRVGGIEIGEPLADFRGVLTGIPVYTGSDATLAGALNSLA